MIDIIGGTYWEVCLWPAFRQRYGSGLRAARSLYALNEHYQEEIRFNTFCEEDGKEPLKRFLEKYNITTRISTRPCPIEFQYQHPLDPARPFPDPWAYFDPQADPIDLGDLDTAILFSTVEGRFKFNANVCVYDPQEGSRAKPFRDTGAHAEDVAIVANVTEIKAIAKSLGFEDDPDASLDARARYVLEHDTNVNVVVVKNGIFGAHIAEPPHDRHQTPAYITKCVRPIGSGDVFTAVFGYLYCQKLGVPHQLADWASLSTAYYCSSEGALPVPSDFDALRKEFEATASTGVDAVGNPQNAGCVYIAAPLFTLSQVWLIDSIRRSLLRLGVQVWSPYHDEGLLAEDADENEINETVKRDLEQLDPNKCNVVLAVLDGLDPGTLFEIGYACRPESGIDVIAYTETASKRDLTMLHGSPNCSIKNDLSSALYDAAWKAFKL